MYLNTISIWGGGEKQTLLALNHLQQRGHSVFLGCQPGSPIGQRALDQGLKVIPFPLKMDIAFWKIPPLRRFLQKEKIDVLVCAQTRDVKIGALAGRLAGVPAIFSYQGVEFMKRKPDHRIAFTRFIDGIITNTQSIKDNYLQYGWFDRDFIHVVYGGTEPPGTVEAADLHGRYGLASSSKVILSAGRLDHQKGFDILIEAAGLAKDRKLDWTFLIAGNGKMKSKLEKLILEKEVNDYVRLIGFQSDILPLMKAADLFVLPSRYEGMPNAVREAMALGRACVATAVNGVPELIEHGKSGMLVEKENARQLFETMFQVLNDRQLRSTLEENAALRIRERFSVNQMIDHLEELFTAQLAKNKTENS